MFRNVPATPTPRGVSQGAAVRPSPVFWAVVALTAFGAWLTVSDVIGAGAAVFVFVASGWVLSLILHEFSHAFVAWRGGDHSVVARGYLSLDPRLYTDPMTSLLLPLLLVAMGGIGLPGGAVWIDRGALRSPVVSSLVSLAGPASNLVFAVLCLLPQQLGLVSMADTPTLAIALAFLGFLQITAFVINMLPIPGLDGFGALEPFLPPALLSAIAPVRRYSILLLFFALWFVEPVNRVFWDVVLGAVELVGIDADLVVHGFRLFRFWEV